MVARTCRSRRLDFVPAGRIVFQVEAIGKAAIQILEVRVGKETNLRRDVGRACGIPAGVLVHNGNRVVITPVAVPTAELYALGRAGESETVVHVLSGGTEVGLIVNVPTAQVPTTRGTEWQVEFKLANAQAQDVGRQFEEAPDIDELQVSVAQSTAGAGAANADVVIDPESDVTAEISGHEYAKQSRLKVGPRDERSKLSLGQLQVEVIAILAHDLEEGVEAQSDRRQTWNGPRPDGTWPKLFLGGRSQHDGRYLN